MSDCLPDCLNNSSSGLPGAWQQAKLLNRYYEKVGRAAAGEGHCPRFVEFAAGFGCVIYDDPKHPVLTNIPPDMETIPEEFYRAEVEVAYSDGVTLCKCEIPKGTVVKPLLHNLIGIFDQDGELVAVCITLPDWVTPDEIYRAVSAITFPMEKTTPPAEEEPGEGDTGAENVTPPTEESPDVRDSEAEATV